MSGVCMLVRYLHHVQGHEVQKPSLPAAPGPLLISARRAVLRGGEAQVEVPVRALVGPIDAAVVDVRRHIIGLRCVLPCTTGAPHMLVSAWGMGGEQETMQREKVSVETHLTSADA